MNFTRTLIAAALIATSGATFAQAIIDQNRALAGNITPGDTAGFPVTISQPGSYKLTSNLYVPSGQTGIDITGPNVSLDLNGFSIIGVGVCSASGSPTVVTCSTAPTGRGVYAGSSAGNATVRRGTVQGFFTGVDIVASGTIEDITAVSNTEGVQVTGNNVSLVTGVTAHTNVKTGILLIGGGGTLENSRSSRNGLFGVQLGAVGVPWTAFNVHVTRNGSFGVAGAGSSAGHGVRASTNGVGGTQNFSLFSSMGNNMDNSTQF